MHSASCCWHSSPNACSEHPRIEPERIAFDHKPDSSVLRMDGVEQQVALKRLDKRRDPQAKAGSARQPIIPQTSGQRHIRCPVRSQSHVDHIIELDVVWQIQAHEDLVFDRQPAGVYTFFQLAQRTAGTCVDNLSAGSAVPSAIEEGRAKALAHENVRFVRLR